jgi:amino-acid N-acetyltransferase
MGPRVIRGAKAEDRSAVEALLEASGLPTDGVAEHFESFFVADQGDRIVGAAGLELYAGDALLRSVVVASDVRGTGLGTTLARRALDEARAIGVRAAYLLTTTAESFFPRLGFARIEREDVPPRVRASREFSGVCPASATVMRREL